MYSFLKRLLKPEMFNEWIYFHGIERMLKSEGIYAVVLETAILSAQLNGLIFSSNSKCVFKWYIIYINSKISSPEHNVFQIGVGEKLALSLDTSDTLVALVAIFLDAIASPSTYPCQSVGQW